MHTVIGGIETDSIEAQRIAAVTLAESTPLDRVQRFRRVVQFECPEMVAPKLAVTPAGSNSASDR
jgi:hypothetical protein